MNWPDWLPLKSNLKTLSPYGAPQVPAKIRINTNENPNGPSPEIAIQIAARIKEIAANLNRYPDRDAIALRNKLADYLGNNLTQENIWAANGSNEILQSIFLAFGSGSALGFTPSYSMHPLIANVVGVNWINGERRDDFTLDTELVIAEIAKVRPTLVFITTPNNPTGDSVSISNLEKIAAAAKQVDALLVVDEAYAEFSDEPSAVTLIPKYPNILVSRTMSKAFAFAGVRLGYLAADSIVIDALQLVRLPYHLGSLTQAAAEVALDFKSELLATVAEIINQRKLVANELEALGLNVLPSSANFLLFGGFNANAKIVWEKLLNAGVLIRDVGLPGYLRVTIGTAAENKDFLNALKVVLKS